MATAKETVQALAAIIEAIYETIKESGDLGAPSGIIYAAVMGVGINLETYNAIIDAMVKSGKVRKSGDLLFACK